RIPQESHVGVWYLAGGTRQGRSGIGWAAIRGAQPASNAPNPKLTLIAVDAALGQIAGAAGRGSIAERTRLLSELFARATAREQAFLARLLLGELRQGALEGIMIEAVGSAAGVPAETVSSAAMVEGGIDSVAAHA